MIQLTCTNCKTVLTIDDAFAGGACRCQYCGTIQTVPVPATASKRPATPGSAAPAAATPPQPKALYKGSIAPAADSGNGDGLQALAQVVASSGLGSGLTGTGLRSAGHQQRAAAPAEATSLTDRKPLLIAAAIIGAVLLLAIGGTLAYLAGRSSGKTEGAGSGASSNTATADPAVKPPPDQDPVKPATPGNPASPNYMNAPLAGPSVVYILDRGQGTADTFDAIKGAAHLSILSLGPDRKFQILFWDRDGTVVTAPDSLKPATEAAVKEATKVMADVFVGGQTKIAPAIEKAITLNPAEIVIATGKYGLDDEFVKSVLEARKSSTAKIHTFSLGRSGSPEPLKQIAEKTGGRFTEVSGPADLRNFASWSPN